MALERARNRCEATVDVAPSGFGTGVRGRTLIGCAAAIIAEHTRI